MANDALEQSLRAEIDKHFNARLNELREEMSRVQELLNDTVSRHKTETDSIISNMMDKISSEDDTMNAVIAEHLRNAEEVAAQAAAERAAAEAAAEAATRAEARAAAARAEAEQRAAQAEAEKAAAQAEAEQRAAQAEAEKAAAQSAAEQFAAKVEAEKAAAQAALEQATAQAAAESAARAAAEEAANRAAQEKAAAEEAAARAAQEKSAAEEAAREAARAAEEKVAAEHAAAEKARQKISENIGLLRNAIVDLGKQKSQAEILKTLVGYASSLAPRVAFFVVKEGHTKGWRAFGFENTVGNDSINQIVLPLTNETLLGESVNSQTTWDGAPGQFRDDYKLLSSLGSVTPNRIVAVPLVARSRSVAVLYADSANDDAGSINVDAIESLVRVAAMNVEMLAASRAAHSAVAAHPQPAQQQPVAQPIAQPTVQPTPEPAPQAEAISATPAAPVEETATTGPLTPPEEIPVVPVEPSSPEAETIPVSVAEPVEEKVEEKVETTSFDLSGYEAVKPVESAPTTPIQTYAPVETPVERQTFAIPSQPQPAATVTPLTTDSRFRRRDIDLPIEVSEEERRYHNEARRFARLLVSEIKLYNEPKVKEGRETRDLYDRLREAIDRSREMYDKRVSPQVASKFDYFHYELVNTLAEGDENKLGGDYPGASI